MNNVVREEKKRRERPLWQIVSVVLVAVIFINFLITLTNTISKGYRGWVSILILVVSISTFVIIGLKMSSNYIYILKDDRLIFKRAIGNKDTTVLQVELQEIEYLKLFRNDKDNKKVDLTYKFVCDRDCDKFYVGKFERNGRKYKFIFKPSDRLLKNISRDIKVEIA